PAPDAPGVGRRGGGAPDGGAGDLAGLAPGAGCRALVAPGRSAGRERSARERGGAHARIGRRRAGARVDLGGPPARGPPGRGRSAGGDRGGRHRRARRGGAGRPRRGVGARRHRPAEAPGGAGLGAPARDATPDGERRADARAAGERVPSRDAQRQQGPHQRDRAAPRGRGAAVRARRQRRRLRGGGRGPQPSRGAGGAERVPGRGGGGAAPGPGGRRIPVKGFGNIMKEAQKLQAQMEQLQAEAAKKTVEATAGGGMVTAVANGKQELVSIKIDREVINPEDAQMLEDLVMAATNEALRKSKEMVQSEMGKITAGLKIPGLGPGVGTEWPTTRSRSRA